MIEPAAFEAWVDARNGDRGRAALRDDQSLRARKRAAGAALALIIIVLPAPRWRFSDADAAASPAALTALVGGDGSLCSTHDSGWAGRRRPSRDPGVAASAICPLCAAADDTAEAATPWQVRYSDPVRERPDLKRSRLGASAAEATPSGTPTVADSANPYAQTGAGRLSSRVAGAMAQAYVPDVLSNAVDVIDTATLKVINRFSVGLNPQHIVPAWDLKTLWVVSDAEMTNKGSVTPIDPMTGKPGSPIAVDDPYNMYFTPDGKSAIVVAEARARLDFRDPRTMALQSSLAVPECAGINHADFSVDGRYAIFTCEFGGALVKIDVAERKVLGYLKLSKNGMPQDIRISPRGKTFFVADMMSDGVILVDGDTFVEVGFIPTGIGTHGLYPSRDGEKLYVSNRGSHKIRAPRHGPGSVSVIDFDTQRVLANWPIAGGGSPDMGNVSADGKQLWLAGRFDDVVYVFDTATGAVTTIPVGREPHGLTIWPQPGRYSLGHTGIMR